MKQRMRGNIGWLVFGLLVGSLFSGVAVAKIMIPPNSVSEKSLTKGLRKKINRAAAAVGPQGMKGEKGEPGPQGASGEPSSPPFDIARAYGLVSPWSDELELSRSRNAILSRPDGAPAGFWCIAAPTIDPARMLVQVSPADEPHVTVGGNEIPVVRWNVYPTVCDSREVEIETAIFDTLEGDYNPTSFLPFTFVIEEGVGSG